MTLFNIIKDICELLYYLVGIAGLLTIYYTVKSNLALKEEKEEMENEKIINFLLDDYEKFKEWKKILENQKKIISIGNINFYVKEKKLPQEKIAMFAEVLQNCSAQGELGQIYKS